MRFSIFTHAEHKCFRGRLYSYAPYVKEMNLWISHFDEICVLGPVSKKDPASIDSAYTHDNLRFKPIPGLHFKNKKLFSKSVLNSFRVIREIFLEMKKADHIHIRCPGNIGLLACLIQIFFSSKPKTIKYAGNWAPEAEQPRSYRFQKWLVSNTFLTRNAHVLVYGEWGNQSRNVIPFFTASYSEEEKIEIHKEFRSPFKFVFAGSLVEGKRPFFALDLIKALKNKGFDVELEMYGNGILKVSLEEYIDENKLEDIVTLHGNQPQETVKKAYLSVHFSILPSKSEGWPKAIAEAMYFGCVPIATEISCVPWMLGEGTRGILIKPDIESAVGRIISMLKKPDLLQSMSEESKSWSQSYTLEGFDREIEKLL
ncbi:glycosyltransferase [Gramella sp. MT6]|uniref:glycosyltransferase family 4 protein n=1 Tax=Gramella sp. MT6 TaxID=2705471 RepID=UPI001C5F4198|nr:glycosyltransferase [Gramella sp. MT6]QYA24005.1 glycosyltransferase [Gramella sp. MT6]